MSATIKQIASAAGVSTASVSRALNQLPGVGPQTRQRILDAASALGYTPDSRGQALKTGQVPFLGLVLGDIENPFFPAVARGAEEEALSAGYSLLLVNTAWRSDRLERALQLLISRRVGGLLLAVPLNGLQQHNAWSEQLNRAVVMVGQATPRGSGLGAVEVDDRHGGYLVGRHLLRRGWRSLAFVGGPRRARATRARLGGMRKALTEAGRPGALRTVSYGQWSADSGLEQARQLLRSRPRGAAIFAANDLLALGVARAADEAGLRLGQDLGLVGYDDIDTVRYLSTPITSVAQPKAALGQQATRMLLALLEGVDAQRRLRLRPRLKVRTSCGAADTQQQQEQT